MREVKFGLRRMLGTDSLRCGIKTGEQATDVEYCLDLKCRIEINIAPLFIGLFKSKKTSCDPTMDLRSCILEKEN